MLKLKGQIRQEVSGQGVTVGMTKAMELEFILLAVLQQEIRKHLLQHMQLEQVYVVCILPSGKVALGKLAQAMFHGAEVMSINGNFDEALEAMTALALENIFTY